MDRTERQIAALKKWKASNYRGTLVMCTGFGKTHTAILAIKAVIKKMPDKKITVVVPTTMLLEQWKEKLIENKLQDKVDLKVINTAASKNFECDFLVLDEVHRYNADSFSKVFLRCFPRLILGLTATYERLDQKEKTIMDKICPPCDTVSVEEAVSVGWLAPYIEYKVVLNVDLTKYIEYDRDYWGHYAFFNNNNELAFDCLKNREMQLEVARYCKCSVSDVIAHATGWIRAMTKRKNFVYNHPYKLEVAKRIIEARKDKKIITFNSSIKRCEEYKEGYVVHSGKTKKINKEIIEEFATKPNGVIHSAKLLEEGLDCPGLSVAIVTGFNSSKTSKIQRTGRCIRAEKGKTAEIFTILLKGTVEERWFNKSTENLEYIEINEDELEKVLKREPLDNKRKIKQMKKVSDFLRF